MTMIVQIIILIFAMKMSNSQEVIKIRMPDGGIFHYSYYDGNELQSLLRNGDWALAADQPEYEWFSLYHSKSGIHLEVFRSDEATYAYSFDSKSDYRYFKKNIVAFTSSDGMTRCPFLLLEREDVAKTLETGMIVRQSEEGSSPKLFSFDDGRILKTDAQHSYGEQFRSWDEFVIVEKEMGGSVPIILMPILAKDEPGQPEGAD